MACTHLQRNMKYVRKHFHISYIENAMQVPAARQLKNVYFFLFTKLKTKGVNVHE